MDTASPPDPAGGSGRLLLVLRHALADPLSSAALKLDLIERRLTTPSGADPAWALERVRAAQGDVATATRLIDLLVRLAEIAAERPAETSLHDVCLSAGVPLDESAVAVRPLPLRQRASAEAVRNVASFAAGGDGVPSAIARAELEGSRVTLAVELSREAPDGHPERLLELPHGIPEAETLFLARAAVEADGGRLELTEHGGHRVVRLSWPVDLEGGAEQNGSP